MNLLLSLALLTLCIALCYISNKHQRIFNKAVSKQWRTLSILFLGAGIGVTAQQLSWSATVFFCAMTVMLCCILLPLLTLFKKTECDHDK